MRSGRRCDGRARLATASACAAAAIVPLAPGCGGQTLTAEEFVAEANRNGAGIELGEPLLSDQEGKEVYAIELGTGGTEAQGAPHGGGEGHSGGSLTVRDSVAAADQDLVTCEAAADLICFQAGNVVVILEPGSDPVAIAHLAQALERMGQS